MGQGANDRRDHGRAVRAIAGAAAWLLAAITAVPAAEPDFSAAERHRLARITRLPAAGDLDAGMIAAVTFTSISAKDLPDFSDADCRALGRLPKLASVTLHGLPLSAACVDALPRSPVNLTLDGVAFAPDTLAALGRMPGLVGLRIDGGTGLTPRLVDALPPTSSLLRLAVGDVDGETLAALRRVPRLTELEIGAVSGAQGLAPLDGAPELERLVTTDASTGDLEVVARLPKLGALSTGLDESVGEAGLRSLVRSPTLKSVSLTFSGRNGAAGVGILAEMPRLEELRLVYQTVPDRDLARLARSSTLTSLDLREADVTAAGLLSLLKSRSLKSVGLWRVEVADDVRRRLRKRFAID